MHELGRVQKERHKGASIVTMRRMIVVMPATLRYWGGTEGRFPPTAEIGGQTFKEARACVVDRAVRFP